ncbi:flagellar protein [Clostridia bacterium]|nr:flagellar protein [Clostridia bacterium]
MEPTNIKPGTKLVLGLYSQKNSDQSLELYSTFEADEDDGNFVVAAPFYMSAYYPVSIGELLFLSFSDDNAKYDLQGTVTGRFKMDGLAYLRVQRLTEIVRTQRREDFRLEVVFDLELERSLEEDDGRLSTHSVRARTIDLSGGGSAMWCDEYIPEGEKLLCGIPLEDRGGLTFVDSEIRWSRRSDKDSVYKYFIGVKFLHKSSAGKEKIVKFIFGLQRKRMTFAPKKVETNPFDDLI